MTIRSGRQTYEALQRVARDTAFYQTQLKLDSMEEGSGMDDLWITQLD